MQIDLTSIKDILAACEAFEKEVGFGVISHNAERNLREGFEREARAALNGIELKGHEVEKALAECDTVEEMKAVLVKFTPKGDTAGQRIQELLAKVRIDTQKLLGAWYYQEVIKTLGPDKPGMWENTIRLALGKKGLCLTSSPAQGTYGIPNFGYYQKDALYTLGQLLTYCDANGELSAESEKVREGLWKTLNDESVDGFNKIFKTTVTCYKNGNIVIKGLNTRFEMFVAEILAAKFRAWAKEA